MIEDDGAAKKSGAALGLYKPGQGYWVRVMTAVLAGILVAAFAAWSWQQVEALVTLPTPTWEYSFFESEHAQGATPPGPGAKVTLLAEKVGAEGLTRVGEGDVIKFDRGSEGLDTVIVKPTFEADADPTAVSRVEYRQGDSLLMAGQVRSRTGIPIFQMLYLQAAVAGVILLAGSVLVYRFVGTKPKSVEFLIATDGEMKKVNWSTRKTIVDSTWVVIGACFLISTLLFVFDMIFSNFFKAIHVLK